MPKIEEYKRLRAAGLCVECRKQSKDRARCAECLTKAQHRPSYGWNKTGNPPGRPPKRRIKEGAE